MCADVADASRTRDRCALALECPAHPDRVQSVCWTRGDTRSKMLNCSLSHRIMTETKVCDQDTFAIKTHSRFTRATKTQKHSAINPSQYSARLGETRREKAEDIVPAL